MPYSDFDDSTIKFIGDHFQIRECYKYKEEKDGRCVCKKEQNEHEEMSNENEPWTHANNTILKPCDTFGHIKFPEDLEWMWNTPTFIRCDPLETIANPCESIYTLLTSDFKLKEPKLIISIIAGTQKMKFISKRQKRNFYQGLTNVIKTNITWLIGNGYTIGSHKVISKVVYKNIWETEVNSKKVYLIGIVSWGNIRNYEKLPLLDCTKETEESSSSEDEIYELSPKEKRRIDLSYDTYLFCDCEPTNQYNEEIKFRLDFQNYVKGKNSGSLVQILISGEREDIKTIYKALEQNVPHVIIKGSGQIADIISEIVEIPIDDYDGIVEKVLKKYERIFTISNGKYRKEEIDEDKGYLQQMHTKYREQIVIYDMMDTKAKLDKKIIEAIIVGSEKNIEKTLKLCLTFNCSIIAEKFVFSDPEYRNTPTEIIYDCFMRCLEENKCKFVELFMDNDFSILHFLDDDRVKKLYKITFDSNKCKCAELLRTMSRNKKSSYVKRKQENYEKNYHFRIDAIVRILSGYTLHKIYQAEKVKKNEPYSLYIKRSVQKLQKLFLWALLSGRTDLAQVIWTIMPDHIGSALMAAYILQNMAKLIMAGGDQHIQQELKDGSKKFEDLAVAVLDECYNENKTKTYKLLDNKLESWNNLTCLDIAIYGKMLNFLNHSACRSFTTNCWRGELSPFLSIWKILLAIPFSIFMVGYLIAPKPDEKETVNEDINTENQEIGLLNTEELSNQRNTNSISDLEQKPSYWKSFNLFYEAPVVKFSIHFISYITFLLIFCYLNLVELKPFEEVKMAKEVIAEILVYIYLLAHVGEEIRQVYRQRKCGLDLLLKTYFSKSWNWVDVFVISLFIISTTVRFTINKNHFMICRFLFAICLCIFFLRSMQFYFVNETIGPKVIMIRKMIRDVGFFISIFIIFLMCFGTLTQSLRAPNSNFNLGLISDIVYYPYFQMYGELMLDEFRGSRPCNGTICDAKNAIMTISLGIFLLSTNILLINLLIALFGFTVNEVQADSERLWCHIRIQLVQEFKEKQIIPPPFNIIYYPFKYVILKIRRKPEEEEIAKYFHMMRFEYKCFEEAISKFQEDTTIGPVKA